MLSNLNPGTWCSVGYCFFTEFLGARRESVSGSSGHWRLDEANSASCVKGRNGASVNITDDTADKIDETARAKASS